MGAAHVAGYSLTRQRLWLDGVRDTGAEPVAPPVLSGDGERMSEFLRRLTARSFTTVPSLRPRLAAFFEPPASVAAPLVREAEGRRRDDAALSEAVSPEE